MNKKWFIALLALVLILTACMPAPKAASAQLPNTENQDPLPDEDIGEATIQWNRGLADPEFAGLAIVAIGGFAAADDATVVGVLDDPVAVILILGIASYVVVTNPDIVEKGIQATVQGVQGVRDWVSQNFEVTVPAAFSPDGGEVSIQAPGVSFSGYWNKTDSGGCKYHGTLNGISLDPLETPDPCEPMNYLAWIASQLDKIRKQIGNRTDDLMQALNDLVSPFIK